MNERPCLLSLDFWPLPNEQFRIISAAERIGMDIVLIARAVPDWVKPFLKHWQIVDTYDETTTISAAKSLHARFGFAGVARWLDRSVEIGAKICDALNLRGLSDSAALLSRDKFLMKEALRDMGDIIPRSYCVESPGELEEAARHVGFPAVLKPVSASASRGIFKVDDPASLQAAYKHLRALAEPCNDPIYGIRPGRFVLEEFVDGALISINGLLHGEDIFVSGLIDHAPSGDYFVDCVHISPSTLQGPQLQAVRAASEEIIKRIGLHDCAFQIEGLLSRNGFRFLELAARTPGDYNATHLLPDAYGHDYIADCLRVYAGSPPLCPKFATPVENRYFGTQYLLARQAGRFEALNGVELVSRIPGFETVLLEQPKGARVGLPPDNILSARLAAIFAQGTTSELVGETLCAIVRQLEPVITTSE